MEADIGECLRPGRLDHFPHDMGDERYRRAGMLPFRVEQCYGELVKILREKRLKKWNRDWKLRLIEEKNPDWNDLFDTLNC